MGKPMLPTLVREAIIMEHLTLLKFMLIMQGNGLVMLKLKITDLSTAQLLFIIVHLYVRPVVLSNTRLRIYDIPEQKFQFEGSTKTVIRGSDVLLTCPVYGNPKVQFVWFKGAQDIGKDERIHVDNNGTLLIKNVTYLDHGIYTCKAVNTITDRFSSVNKKVQSTVSIERYLRIKSEFSWLLPLGVIILLVFLLLFIIVFCEMRKRRKEQKQLISVNSGADDD
uniref:Ig-like domain-containing protein n=1 Tax=Meloidogyne incognita TaxID=6306 RepID=A0A914KMP1_MELIC